MTRVSGSGRSVVASLAAALLVLVGMVVPVGAAQAADEPASTDEPIVTADALPTVQINGVVWDQLVVGNTVYVAGDFTNARPAGAAAGTSLSARSSLLAYDVRTGQLLSWAPRLNGPGYALAASPDGTRIYVGGNFTQVNSSGRNRFAAVSASTGAVLSGFTSGANAPVRSIAANASQVFIGGNFTIVGGQDRPRLASFDAATGALRSWRVSVQPYQVDSVALSTDGTRLFVGGRFERLNGVASTGMGAVSTSTGATLPWAANKVITNSGYNAGITSISTDGQLVYGTGFAYNSDGEGYGNLEGSFAADPATGDIRWIADCRGDTYSLFPNPGKKTVYIAGHPHNCGNISEYPEFSPRIHKYGLAITKDARTINNKNAYSTSYNFGGRPAPALRTFFPDFVKGTFTGQGQATWDVSGNGEYVVYGGEFPSVNGVNQQGLTRFAVRASATNRQGPRVASSSMTPVARSLAAGTVQLSWPSNWDRDDEILTYRVLRGSTVVYSVNRASSFWHLPRISYTDTGLSSGTSYSYRVQAVDSTGNSVTSGSVSVTAASSGSQSAYAREVLTDNPSAYWRMGNGSGDFTNWTAHSNAGAGSGVVRNETGAIAGDTDRAARFTGSDSSRVYARSRDYSQTMFAPNRFSVEAWFKTTSTSGGKIIGLGSTAGTTTSSTFDRHIYMRRDGRLTFGVRPVDIKTVTSPSAYNDGRWHHVVATLGRAGMRLYVDGAEVASNTGVTSGRMANGYWRIGGDSLSGWPEAGGYNFVGSIDEVATYGYALPSAEIARHNQVGRGTTAAAAEPASNVAPTASFTEAVSGLQVQVDGSGSTDPDGSISRYDWDFGDGSTATGVTASRTYAAAGTYTIRLTVTDNAGAQGSTSRQVTVSEPSSSVVAADSFERSVASGLGSADVGGTWLATSGTSVSGAAQFALGGASATVSGRLPDASANAATTRVTTWFDKRPNGGGVWTLVRGRITSGGEYRLKTSYRSDGSLVAWLVRTDSTGKETTVGTAQAVPGLTYGAGTRVRTVFEVSGAAPTTLRAKIWLDGQAEPSSWLLQATDSTSALQTSGHLGLAAISSGSMSNGPVVVRFDNLDAS
jgi:PKD repeat protein